VIEFFWETQKSQVRKRFIRCCVESQQGQKGGKRKKEKKGKGEGVREPNGVF